MVIYEVSLVVDEEIYSEYRSWLKTHIRKMLEFPGFIKASILTPENEKISGKKKLTVHYQLESREFLTAYFTEYSFKMRGEAVKRFQDKFSAERRVFGVDEFEKGV